MAAVVSSSTVVNPAVNVNNSVRQHEQTLVKSSNGEELRFELVNVVCMFKTHCHIDLKALARQGANVEHRRDPPSVLMKIRHPRITASIWSAGKVTCIGARSEADAKLGARRVARKIQNCGFAAKFVDFKIINCLAVAYLPFGVRIDLLKDAHPHEVDYEPELHPAASWKLPEVGGQIQVFQTGNCTITAPNGASARKTLATVYAKLYEFRKPKDTTEHPSLQRSRPRVPPPAKGRKRALNAHEPELDEFQAELKAFKLEEDPEEEEEDEEEE